MVFNGKWFILAIICLVLVAIIDLSKKYILDKNIINPNEMVIYTTILVGFFGLLHWFCDKKCRPLKKLNSKIFIILITLAFLGYLFALSFTYSTKLSPDVTLVGMIISLNIIFLYVFSSIFFEASPKFNMDVFFALMLIVLGINIIAKKF
jgi:drug/metabolite transporter (DMT)-like permease